MYFKKERIINLFLNRKTNNREKIIHIRMYFNMNKHVTKAFENNILNEIMIHTHI